MNPALEFGRPFNPPPRLVDPALPAPGYVPVTLTRGYPATSGYLDVIERLWGPERDRLAAQLHAHGEPLESGHWDWRNKARRQPHWHCLVTVECEGAVQGVMAVENLLRPSRLNPSVGVLYVDYVEIAPWNYRVPSDRGRPAVRLPRFTRVGTLLLCEAIRMSFGLAGGRVGLHALEQAESFYTRQCGLTSHGPDPHYHGLVYFEYAEGVAAEHLIRMGCADD